MKHIVIIGGGPRGLAVALRASMYNYKVTVVDKAPLSTWTFPYMLPDIQMRSPITFDLVTFCPELSEYSLANFLNKPFTATTQQEVEACKIYCRRQDFINYLNYIVEALKYRGVTFAKHHARSITETHIECKSIKLEYDYLVIAAGRKVQEPKCPSYLKNKELITIKDLPNQSWKGRGINVIGSGQQAAEIVEYLCGQKAKVVWLQKHKPKVAQYPAPSYTEWGPRTALGDGYHKIINKAQYLKRVKEWGPSITPYIASKLERCNYGILHNPGSTSEINMNYEFILAAGADNKVELLNLDFDIDKNYLNPILPRLNNNFQSTSNPNIYFTGLLALLCDGPRQGSIISSGYTAKIILENINHDES